MRPALIPYVVVCALVFCFGVPRNAQGFVSEGQVWGAAGTANINHAAPTLAGWWGPKVEAGVALHLNDFFRVTADVSSSHHFERMNEDDEPIGPHTVLSTAIGARYSLDVLTYVPWVGLAFGYHPLGPPSEQAATGDPFSLRATIGIDYRRSRTLSFGGAVHLHAPLTDPGNFPHYSAIRLHVAYHFRWY